MPLIPGFQEDPSRIKDAAARALERCAVLARFSESETGITRTFLCPQTHEVHRAVLSWMAALGMETSVDAAGNVRGIYSAQAPHAPRLLIGSHLDTVPNAGAYDGILGVMLGLALIEALDGRRLLFEIELIGFSEEEGVRFGAPFLGSRALIGTLDADTLALRDQNQATIAGAIRAFGLDPALLPQAELHRDRRYLGYFELHIEQGPVLESHGWQVAAVSAIVGQSRFSVTFTGQANHAGATPMHLRRDALAGAAEWVLEVERVARAEPGLASTVGRLQVEPGAGNVIPGTVSASLDVRHPEDAVRLAAASNLLQSARTIAERRGLRCDVENLLSRDAVTCDPHLTGLLREAIAAAGFGDALVASGAGHDAMIAGARLPIAMLFLRSPGGISHHPDESVLPGDVEAAIYCGLHFLRKLERSF